MRSDNLSCSQVIERHPFACGNSRILASRDAARIGPATSLVATEHEDANRWPLTAGVLSGAGMFARASNTIPSPGGLRLRE